MQFQGKKILVLGAGISGIAVASILQKLGSSVTLSDQKSIEAINKDLSEVAALGVKLSLGIQDESLLEGTDYIVLSPGISIYIPLVKAAQTRGIVVMSEIEVAYQLCKAPIIAVTGTNGKTTTTTIIGEMVRTTGREVVVGGNIGQALSQEVASIDQQGIVVAEISSFQLEGAINFKPRIAAILNITPDHIDRHRDMETYISMKEKIATNQTDDDYLILNYDDLIVREIATRAKSNIVFFSRKEILKKGIFVEDDVIKIAWAGDVTPVCSVNSMKIKGAHNVENALAACGIAFFAGVTLSNMANVLESFDGVEHRIEPVATIDGVAYFNDSKATNPESAIKALEAFPGNIVLIAGGRDKKTDLTDFMRLVKERVTKFILIGEASERFRDAAIAQGVECVYLEKNLKNAVCLAHTLAKEPEVVLLSPACSSYDMFHSYEERGMAFKNFVRQLG